MELCLKNGFCELSELDVMLVEGGVDWVELASGVVQMAVGVVGGALGVAEVMTPGGALAGAVTIAGGYYTFKEGLDTAAGAF